MKAAIYHGVHQPHTVEDVEIDGPRAREVVVRTVGSGVCHTDLHYVEGTIPITAPAILGHECAGIVTEVGSEVASVRPGDHVVAFAPFCGTCDQCLTGNPHRCRHKPVRSLDDTPRITLDGARVHGSVSQINGFAEQLLLHENAVVSVPPEMPLDVASIIGCAVITGVGAALNTAKVRPGSTVAVFGAGGVGLSIVQGAAIAGARRIIVVDLLDAKLDVARQFGATHTVNGREDDAVAHIRSLTDGGVDYAFDAVGSPTLTTQAMQSLTIGGTTTMVGAMPRDATLQLAGGALFAGERTLQSCTMGSNRFRLDVPVLVDLYLQGRLRLDEMVTRRGGLDELDDMLDTLKTGEGTRQVIQFA